MPARVRIVVRLMLIGLVSGLACGGEGASFNRLRIEPKVVYVKASDAPMTFEGKGRAQGPIRWELVGVGSLDRTTGAIVIYTPPTAGTGTAELRVFDYPEPSDFAVSTARVFVE